MVPLDAMIFSLEALSMCYSTCRSVISGDTGNRSRKFIYGVALASASVAPVDVIPSLEAMLTFPP